MIRNLVILDRNGRSLLSSNFGECHSFGDNDALISGFISAIYMFSRAFAAGAVKQIQLGSLSFMLISQGDLIFALSADDEAERANKATLLRIVNVFSSRYGTVLPDQEDELDTMAFHTFPQYLVKEGILRPNCGKYEECIGCENNQKSLPLSEMIESLGRQ